MAYIVYNDNTLGYTGNFRKPFCSMIVLRVDYMAGGDPLTIGKVVLVNTDKARLATKEDFERFKVIV